MQNLVARSRRGFTLIELLIVIAIIAVLAAVTFVALNPLRRFQDTRDSRRWSDITQILSAIKIDQVDRGGTWPTAINALTAGQNYMIVNGSSMTAGCDDNNTACDLDPNADTNCVNLNYLVTGGYLSSIPVSPSSGAVTWDDGDTAGEEGTGYVLSKSANNAITIAACESENATSVSVTR